MIEYTLKCANGHEFTSWFNSSGDYDRLKGAGLVSCAICDSVDVDKSLMAPKVNTAPKLRDENNLAEKALREIRENIEKNATDVGWQFATKARQMHIGEIEEKPIYGQASGEDVKSLLDDGIAVAPLPFSPRKQN